MFDSWESFVRTVNIAGFAWNDLLGQGKNVVAQVGGIQFPAQQVANANPNVLDDYEEGVWTPTDASGATLTLTTPTGTYTKIGNIVIVTGSFTYPVTVNGANAGIGGFPFSTANLEEARSGVLSYHGGATATKFLMGKNVATGNFFTNAGAAVTNAQMSTTLNYIQAIYKVA